MKLGIPASASGFGPLPLTDEQGRVRAEVFDMEAADAIIRAVNTHAWLVDALESVVDDDCVWTSTEIIDLLRRAKGEPPGDDPTGLLHDRVHHEGRARGAKAFRPKGEP